MIMAQYRIIEEIDGNGQSLFYPEKKGIFGIWFRYHHDCGTVDYLTKEAALYFIKQQTPKKEVVHEIQENI
jgi:hypothetical protein